MGDFSFVMPHSNFFKIDHDLILHAAFCIRENDIPLGSRLNILET